MILSHGRKYILIHIPKTGGTALTLALEGRAKADDILVGDTPKARARAARQKPLALQVEAQGGRLWKHSTLQDLAPLVPDLAGYFVATLVRNPFDRIVSYYHWLKVQSFAHPAVTLAQSTDFEGFLRAPKTLASLKAHPYASYLRRDGAERCDAFIRLEHLAQDLAPFTAHLGFALEVGRANASERAAEYRGYYSPATRALVEQICAEDLARFGYAF